MNINRESTTDAPPPKKSGLNTKDQDAINRVRGMGYILLTHWEYWLNVILGIMCGFLLGRLF